MIVKNAFFPRATLVSSLSLAVFTVVFSPPAHAIIFNFTGSYEVSNWETFGDDGNSVDTSGAPKSTTTTSLNGLDSQGDNTNFMVNAGEELGFYAKSTEEFSSAVSTNITNSSAIAVPLNPPEADAWPLVGSTLFMIVGLWWKRKRNQAKVSNLIANSVTVKT